MLNEHNPDEHFYLHTLAFDEMIRGYPKERDPNTGRQVMLKNGKGRGYRYSARIPYKIDPQGTMY